jgi:hypothetical protein
MEGRGGGKAHGVADPKKRGFWGLTYSALLFALFLFEFEGNKYLKMHFKTNYQ